jgi:hypothetical protein
MKVAYLESDHDVDVTDLATILEELDRKYASADTVDHD